MKKQQVVVLVDKSTGRAWVSPKGKISWGSVGHAKSSWSHTNYRKNFDKDCKDLLPTVVWESPDGSV